MEQRLHQAPPSSEPRGQASCTPGHARLPKQADNACIGAMCIRSCSMSTGRPASHSGHCMHTHRLNTCDEGRQLDIQGRGLQLQQLMLILGGKGQCATGPSQLAHRAVRACLLQQRG